MIKKSYNLLCIMLLLFIGMEASAQSRVITGTVTGDGDNEPLIGVSVLVKGTSIGTVSDLDGKYSIAVPKGDQVLIYSYTGFVTQEVTVGSSSNINITMQEDVMGLEEAVVTALAIKKEVRSLGYSAQKVGGDELAESGEVNVIQGLAAKTSGVQVVGSGGTPGASSKILIRGNASFTRGNQPLIVIDGIPIDNSQGNMNGSSASDYPFNAGLSGVNSSNRGVDLNPADIESVTVLKGPAATALYGSRAGNGAIIYTTKRYKSGVKATFSSSVEISQVNKMPGLQSEYAQGSGGAYTVADPGPDGLWFTADDVAYGTSASWGPKIGGTGGEDLTSTDNVDNFFQNGVSWNNNLSFSGGSQKANYRLSIGNSQVTGTIPNTDWDRTSIRLTSDVQLTDKLKLGGTANYVNSGGTRVQNGSNLSGVMLGLTRAPASFDLTGGGNTNPEDGAVTWKLGSGNQYQYFYPYDNPYWTVYENPSTDNVDRMIGNFDVLYNPNSWLTVAYKLGIDAYTDSRQSIFAVHSWDPPSPTGQVEQFVVRSKEVYSDLILTGVKDFSDKLSGKLSVGNNLNHRFASEQYLRGRNLSVEGFYNLSNASNLYAGNSEATVRTSSLFVMGDLDFDNTYYLSFTGRNDWASTFGEGQNNFFYPSVNAAIVFTELMEANTGLRKYLDFGKLRLGYAQTGIEPPVYSSQTYYGSPTLTDGFTDGIAFPFTGVNGFTTSEAMGNPDLKPERQIGTEIGLDLRFFKGRLTVDYTYYNQKSVDILLFRPLAQSSGFRFQYTNAGEMVNKGHELSVGGTPIQTESGFDWNIVANFTQNISEVTALAQGVDEVNIETAFSSIGSFAIIGQPYGALFGTQWARTDDGQLLINPSTGLPLLEAERGNVGNPFPDFLLNIRNTFTYKGLRLSALLDIREGGDIWCGTCARLNRLGRSEESANREEMYVIEGVLADANGESTGQANNVEIDARTYFERYLGDNGAAVEQAVFDGSWVRLRELTLSYDFDIKKDMKVLKTLNVYFTGRNLWLSTDYPGVDPETSLTGSSSNVNGFDYFNNPGTKSYIFGLKAGF